MRRPAIHTQILIALVLGVCCGIFFGELMAPLERVGTAFILLLKMTVVPFMTVALIHAIGSLTIGEAKHLFVRGLRAYLILWTSTLTVIYLLGLALPTIKTPLYYAESPVAERGGQDLLTLFIPQNPFYALVHDVIPAIVLFSLLFGAALMRLSTKGPVLDLLETITQALVRITRWIITISPIGIFALIASSSGTIQFQDLAKIRIYLILYFAAVLVLTFWIFPSLVQICTPISRKQFLSELRPVLLIGFTTGNVLVALPYLVTSLEALCKPHHKDPKSAQSTIASMVPISYNFPSAGNLLSLLFLLFLGYFYAIEFSLWDHLKLTGLGLFALFGAGNAVINALSFLLDKLQLPSDGLSLFLQTAALTRNIQSLITLSGMALVALLVCFPGRRPWKRLAKLAFRAILIIGSASLGFQYLASTPPQERHPAALLKLEQPQESSILAERPAPPGQVRGIEAIRQSGILRVGYYSPTPPFAFLNQRGELVGLDIAIAHQLAASLKCRLMFIPFDFPTLREDLDQGLYDIALGALSVTDERLSQMAFTEPYQKERRAFVTEDYRRKEFTSVEDGEGLTLGALKSSSLEAFTQTRFPSAQVRPLGSLEAFLQADDLDAVVWMESEAKLWALSHPAYTVVLPSPSLGHEFYALAIQSQNREVLDYVNYWLDLKTKEGWLKEQYQYWILGEDDRPPPRWSLIRDYLQWIP